MGGHLASFPLRPVPYPTTVILLAVIGAVTALGWQGTIDGAAVTAILSGVVGAVTVGHYVKTSNGSHQPPTTTTTTVEGGNVRTTTEPSAPPAKPDEKSTL